MSRAALFEPGRIGSLKTRNRIAMPAFHVGLAEDGLPGDAIISFYARRAEGGAGMITVGVCNTWSGGMSVLKGALDISSDRAIEPMAKLAGAVKRAGCVAGIQLSPLAGYNNPRWHPELDEIEKMVNGIGTSARRAREAGFDFVELMLSGGSVLSHFLSPVHNQWELAGYSGEWTERLRAPLEAVEAILQATQKAMPVLARIHGHEFLVGGYNTKGACLIADALVQAGVTAVNVTGGGHRTTLPQLTAQTPSLAFAYLARQVRDAIYAPVLFGGRIRTPKEAENALEISGADFVNLARAFVVDPDWPIKAAALRDEEIIPCMVCNGCLDQAFSGKPLRCSLNPRINHTHRSAVNSSKKRVLVVGSGPAGLQAAWSAHELGHDVTIHEKLSNLGGRWRLASKLRGQTHLDAPLQAFINRLANVGVKMETDTEATPDSVRDFGPDILVLSVGALPRRIDITGIDKHPNVLLAEEAILSGEAVGDKVAIVGAGGVGVELAVHLAGQAEPGLDVLGFLAQNGEVDWLKNALSYRTSRRVTLLRRRGYPGKGLGRTVRWTMVQELKRLGVRVVDRCEYEKISPKGLHIHNNRTDEHELIEADTIIIAAGFEPNPGLLESFRDAAPKIIAAGDAIEVANIGASIQSVLDYLDGLGSTRAG